jgi:hypothetical protein
MVNSEWRMANGTSGEWRIAKQRANSEWQMELPLPEAEGNFAFPLPLGEGRGEGNFALPPLRERSSESWLLSGGTGDAGCSSELATMVLRARTAAASLIAVVNDWPLPGPDDRCKSNNQHTRWAATGGSNHSGPVMCSAIPLNHNHKGN